MLDLFFSLCYKKKTGTLNLPTGDHFSYTNYSWRLHDFEQLWSLKWLIRSNALGDRMVVVISIRLLQLLVDCVCVWGWRERKTSTWIQTLPFGRVITALLRQQTCRGKCTWGVKEMTSVWSLCCIWAVCEYPLGDNQEVVGDNRSAVHRRGWDERFRGT